MNWILKNIKRFLIVMVVIMVIISSSSISATQNKILESKNHNLGLIKEEQNINRALTGLAPNRDTEKTVFKTAFDNKNELGEKFAVNTKPLGETMWGYNVYASGIGEGPLYFDIDDPGNTVTLLAQTTSPNFLSGGAWTGYEQWICCEYGSGILWEVDPEEGYMTPIGGGGTPLNGLSLNPVNNQMYGIGNTDDLFKVDWETGATKLIGSGGTGQTMIALAFDADGECYTWDVKFSGDSYLYSVDIETGACTTIGSMGKTLCFAQDGDFLFSENRLILTAYIYSPEYGGYECEVDPETGELTIIDQFQYDCEIDASMFQNIIWVPHHDVGIKCINYPEDSGHAIPEIPMQVTVKNYGWYNDITDVNMQVIQYEENSIILEEDFSGTFPPEGWTTDWWNQSYTNVTGGEPPEARCYYYDQYYSGGVYHYDYYDNYIQSPQIDCTGVEKINLIFRWAADIYYANYCSVYLKYRKNSTSPWKDVTPWDNPIPSDMIADVYEIGCYGLGESLSDEFQFKFEYLGYYSYFRYWWLDDVTIKSFNYSEDYYEIINDVEVPLGAEVIVDFPNWTPTHWQNPDYENTWEDYGVKACTLLDDIKPKNNCKQKIIELYFPWMHDIEITSIDCPCEDGPGKIYPVKATIKNIGQHPECCIPIDISIGESVIIDTILSEESWDTVPPDGWTDEHKNYASYYGWNKSYSNYSGGSSPETRLPYNYALADYQFYTYALNATDYQGLKLKFKSYIDHYSGSGLYTLHAGYSYDLVNWYTVWSVAPDQNEQFDIEVDIAGGVSNVYVGFWCMGNPYYFDYWYLDDVQVDAVELVEEYSDYMCQGPDIEPGETRIFEFDDWTPDFLQYETTGSKEYIIQAKIDMEGDKNPGNDVKSGIFTLDFWHDAAVEVASPIGGRQPEEWLGFDDGTAVNSLGLTSGGTFQYAIRLTPDELAEYDDYEISSIKRHHGYTTDFTMSGKVKIYEHGTSTKPGDLIREQAFVCYEADWHEIPLDEPVYITGDEDIWVSIEVTHAAGQYPAAMDAMCNYPGKGDWIYLSSWVEVSIYGFNTDWLIRAGVEPGTGPGGMKVYIQPSTQDIEGLASNLGTFPELDLTCWAEIYEYITNCTYGTLVYEDNITDIYLDTPLGGTELLIFKDYNFAEEGPYGLFLSMPDENDDIPKNNDIVWGIGVDDTPPIIEYWINPSTPDGQNGWYVSDVEMSFYAWDPSIGCGYPGSGVKEIKYKIDGGTTQTIPNNVGTFIIDIDKDNLPIEFWAVDNVGNEGIHHTITIDMDQTDPDINLIYEIIGGNALQGWDFVFTATATDATSGMSHVEFYLNDLLQDTIYGPGPTYEWEFTYNGNLNIVVKATGYDMAGNFASDEIVDPENIDSNQLQSKSAKETKIMAMEINKIFYNLRL